MSNYGETLARAVDARVGAPPPTQAAIAAIPLANRYDGQTVMVEADQTEWQFVLASTAAANPGLVIVPADGLGGRWLASVPLVNPSPAGLLPVPLTGAILAAGTPLPAYVAATSVGMWMDGASPKAVVVRWPAGVTTTVWTEVDLPLDLDSSFPATATMLIAKSGATPTDVVSMTVAAYAQTVGALEDAGTNLALASGGTGISPTLTTPQASLPAKTITKLQVPLYLPPTPPARMSISVTPSGTDVTDDVSLVGFWLEYTRKPAVSRLNIDIRAAVLAAGTPMAAWANNAGASAPGVTLDNSKAVGVRWNNQATLTAIWSAFVLPPDMDVSKPSAFVLLVDKSGATGGDTMTCDLTCFQQVPGALEDAGSNLAGTSSAIAAPTATAKTVAKISFGMAPGTFTAAPANCSVSVKPTSGTLGTDDGIVVGFWLEYVKLPTAVNVPIMHVDLKAALLAAGTPMAAWANNAGASAPGVTLDNAKAVGIRWNNFATQTAIYAYVDVPLDFDPTKPLVVNLFASKNGAAPADATTFDVGVFQQVPGALEDATAGTLGFGGTTTALVAAATAKTVGLLTYTIPANTLAAAPCRLTLSVKPTNGTNVTDDVMCNGLWLAYQHV